MRKLITMFLRLNPKPSDTQVHALAFALGVDKETLEARIYKMLGESDEIKDPEQLEADSQDFLENEVPSDATPMNEMALNDGLPSIEDTGFQEETHDDGLDEFDTGVGMTMGDGYEVLHDDGPQTRSL